ncbi:MAG: PAS domain S-box protein [Ignavibacteria bacterium]
MTNENQALKSRFLLFEAISQGVIYFNDSGTITLSNSAAEKILGISAAKLAQQPAWELGWELVKSENSGLPVDINPFSFVFEKGQKVSNVIFSFSNPMLGELQWLCADIIPQFMENETKSFQICVIFVKINNEKKSEEKLSERLGLLYDIIDQLPDTIYIKDTNNQFIKIEKAHEIITGGKKSQDKLNERLGLLYDIIDQLPDTIYIKDTSSRFIKINKAQAKMLRIASVSEAVGKSDFDYFPFEQARQAFNDEKKIMKSGVPIRDKIELIRNENNQNIWVSATKIPVRDKKGNIIGTAGISRDITERKKNEDKVNQSEAQLRAVWENSFDGMRLIDADGKMLLVNEAFCKMVEKERSELLGRDFFSVHNISEQERVISEHQQRFNKLAIDIHTEKEFSLWNGTNLWLEVSHSFIRIRDKEPLLLSIFRNITERKRLKEILEAEKEELRVTLRSITDGVITTDLRDEVHIVNNAALEILECSRNDVVGESIYSVLERLNSPDVSGTDANPNISQELSSWGKIYSDKEIIAVLSKDGNRKTITFTSAEMKNKNNEVIGYVYVLKDITEKVKAATQNLLSQKMESIGQLVAGIAHEINTPMQFIGDNFTFIKESMETLTEFYYGLRKVITTYNKEQHTVTEFVREKEKAIDLKYLMTEIPKALVQSLEGIERVNNIISALKDFAHPACKGKAYYDINKGIQVTVSVSKNEWKYVAELETILDPGLPSVYCSLDEINQVILNMIVNSAHAIQELYGQPQERQGKIIIETVHTEDYVIITISDNGKGIPKENRQRIFDPFFTTKPVGKGTGQGLAIVHNIIVTKHQGDIFVESVIGKGTKFTIQLPLKNIAG